MDYSKLTNQELWDLFENGQDTYYGTLIELERRGVDITPIVGDPDPSDFYWRLER